MKFSSVRLTYVATSGTSTPLDSIVFPFDSRLETSQFIATEIEGLDSPDIDVILGESILPGGVFQARNPKNREIVIHIRFNPTYSTGQTVEDLRAQLYPFLAPKLGWPVSFQVRGTMDVVIATATGHVTRLEVNQFSKDPEVLLHIKCFSPYLIGPLYFVSSPGTLPLAPLSITNIGSAPTGFTMQFTNSTTTAFFRLYDGNAYYIQVTYSFLSGDVITLKTEFGGLAVTVTRSGVTTNLIPYLSGASEWLQLHAGVNLFYMTGPTTWSLNSFTYYPKYWGV